MPKQTYFNLPKDKKDRIFNAGVLEFSYHEVNEASVNTIVRIANISKGSFYQYFNDKSDFYWFIVTKITNKQIGEYSDLLKKFDGDLFQAEEQLFTKMLDLLDDNRYRNIMKNVYRTSYFDLRARLSDRASTVYIDMYDLLMKYGFKRYAMKTKDEFIIVFDMIRNITNNTIMTMIADGLGKNQTKKLYRNQMDVLSKGILKRGLF